MGGESDAEWAPDCQQERDDGMPLRDDQRPRDRHPQQADRDPRLTAAKAQQVKRRDKRRDDDAFPGHRGDLVRQECERSEEDREERRVEVSSVVVDVLTRWVERFSGVEPGPGVVVGPGVRQRIRGQVAEEERDPAKGTDDGKGEEEEVEATPAAAAGGAHVSSAGAGPWPAASRGVVGSRTAAISVMNM